MIDLHCHVLPGIDDGPARIEESVELAQDASADGARVLVATSHVNRRYDNDAGVIAAGVEQVNERLAEEGVAVSVRPGAEISLSRAVELPREELERLTLGGGPWLLIEPPFSPVATGLDILLLDLQRQGHRIVLAHPERCPALRRDPHLLRLLVGQGMLTSITAGSLTGRFGSEVRRFAASMVEEGIVHNVASDAHDRDSRPAGIAGPLRSAGLSAYADWWTREVPGAILAGEELPRRPAHAVAPMQPARRPWWRRLALQR